MRTITVRESGRSVSAGASIVTNLHLRSYCRTVLPDAWGSAHTPSPPSSPDVGLIHVGGCRAPTLDEHSNPARRRRRGGSRARHDAQLRDGGRCVAVGLDARRRHDDRPRHAVPVEGHAVPGGQRAAEHLRHAHGARPGPQRRARAGRVVGGLRGRPDRHTSACATASTFADGSTFGLRGRRRLARADPGRGDGRRCRQPRWPSVTGIEAPDESTVVLTLSAPDARPGDEPRRR